MSQDIETTTMSLACPPRLNALVLIAEVGRPHRRPKRRADTRPRSFGIERYTRRSNGMTNGPFGSKTSANSFWNGSSVVDASSQVPQSRQLSKSQ
jgi:hypothetical protein